MSWLQILVIGASGLAAMRAALERGDIDEAARQGASAGPAVVERALASPDRTTRLAGIAAAPLVEDRGELLVALAKLAGGPDWRTAIPAATAARTIARGLARHVQAGDVADDIADDDVAGWRAAWVELALRGDRWLELRVIALDVAAALDPGGGAGSNEFPIDRALRDPDPAFRRAAATVIALPAPAASFPAFAAAVVGDGDLDVALGAAQSLCMSLDLGAPRPVLDALGAAGLARIRALIAANRPEHAALRDAARCLIADGSPDNVAAARTIPPAPVAPPRPAAPAPAAATDDAATPPASGPARERAPRKRRGESH